jgi:hypothetical protein
MGIQHNTETSNNNSKKCTTECNNYAVKTIKHSSLAPTWPVFTSKAQFSYKAYKNCDLQSTIVAIPLNNCKRIIEGLANMTR